MKIKFLMAALLGLSTATAFAQKGELSNAEENYDKYIALKGTKTGPTASLAGTSLTSAKVSIDKAAANSKTAELPLTYALKGGIYGSLALADSVTATSGPLFNTADEAARKAKELDVKGENKKLIDNVFLTLAQYQLNKGVKEYREKKYDLAYRSFDYYRQVAPEDTNAIYYTGLSAAASGNNNSAISNYNKLIATNFSQNPLIYFDLSSLYIANKDTANALKVVTQGIQKYPSDQNLRKREIEISMETGKMEDVLGKIQTAIANDPKNKELYYYAGLTYAQVAEGAGKDIKTTRDAAVKASLLQKRTENFTKAADMYKKAVEIDPNYFVAALNLGYVAISPAIDQYNAASLIPEKKKEYAAAFEKATVLFNAAKPYVIKATELDPKSVDALNNLKMYYLGTKDTVHANEVQKKIEALSAAK